MVIPSFMPSSLQFIFNKTGLDMHDSVQLDWEQAFMQPGQKSVYVRFEHTGRMGNRIFILASLLGIAYQNNMTVILNDRMNSLKSIFKLNFSRRFPVRRNPLPGAMLVHTGNAFCSDVVKTLWKLKKNLILFQGTHCLDNFKFMEDFIRRELTLNDDLQSMAHHYIKSLYPNSEYVIVGIHVRQGDFNQKQVRARGTVAAPRDYFSHAMEYFNERYKHIIYFVASDDIAWCKRNLNASHIVYSTLKSGMEDFAALVNCDHLIISSGTFSWWAGWLNQGEVVYYEGYPNTTIRKEFTKDGYYPAEWTGMK